MQDLDLTAITADTEALAQNILNESNPDQVKELTQLFNLNQSKKNVLRVLKLNELLDSIADQMQARINSRAGEFSNSDLLDYMTTIASAIEKANKSLAIVAETPAIQLNQQNVNIEINNQVLDRKSRQKITDAVQAILNKALDLNVITTEELPANFTTKTLQENDITND